VFAALRMLLSKQNLTVKQFFSIYFATLIGLALVFLGVTGRLHPLVALIGAAIPLSMRLIPWLTRGAQLASLYRFLRNAGFGAAIPTGSSGKGPQSSEITTRFIHMVLFHDTGMMDGTVLEGQLKDHKLSQLELGQLQGLFQECKQDADSCNLLMAFLDREHEGWQDAGPHENTHQRSQDDTSMTEAQALDILGLDENASRDDIVNAHRRMMQKIHPDRGGSTYLAAKINGAKDFLLKSRGKSRGKP
jgi:hypothetical protein